MDQGRASIHRLNKSNTLKQSLVNRLLHEIELLNIPSDTRALALHPSLPIQLNLPVAPIQSHYRYKSCSEVSLLEQDTHN